MNHNLVVEKIIDKLGNKYEALVRMSIIAKRLADGQGPVPVAPNEKVTLLALDQYLKAFSPSPNADSAAHGPKK